MNPIKEWLNSGRQYLIGIALYEAYGNDPALRDVFRQGESPYRYRRLVEALTKLMSSADRAETITAAEPVHKPVLVHEVPLPETDVPADRDDYRSEWIVPYMEMNSLRHQLVHAPDDHTRGEWCFRILELEKQCMAIWARRDYHKRTGEPMPEEVGPAMPVVTDRNALHRRLTNLRTYVTKENKKALPRTGKLSAWQDEIDGILKSLDNA